MREYLHIFASVFPYMAAASFFVVALLHESNTDSLLSMIVALLFLIVAKVSEIANH